MVVVVVVVVVVAVLVVVAAVFFYDGPKKYLIIIIHGEPFVAQHRIPITTRPAGRKYFYIIIYGGFFNYMSGLFCVFSKYS